MYKCAYCNTPIEHDVARVENNFLFHLSCYRQELKEDTPLNMLYECPRCHTLGRVWKNNQWVTCGVCRGSGHLEPNEAIEKHERH